VIENVIVYRAQDPTAGAREHPLAPFLRRTP